MSEVNPEAREALVKGLARKLKGLPWEPAQITPVVHGYLLDLGGQAATQAAAAFMFGLGDGLGFLRDAYQLSALQRLGADGLQVVIREAWEQANGEPPPDGNGNEDFKFEVMLQMLNKSLP